MKKYIDSNVFIIPLVESLDNQKYFACKNILKSIINNEFEAVTSLLTWDEVVHVLNKKLGREIGLKHGEKFLRMPNLKFVNVDKSIIFLAQRIMNNYNVKPRDAIHSATAILHGDKKIISDDSDFDKINEIKRIKVGKS